jgi:asparagine synthase (glutamine-hydrolysing)
VGHEGLQPHAVATGLTPLEVVSGLVFGEEHGAASLPARVSHPLPALEAALRPALAASPCVVSFSGGVDSSLVLAAAVRLARREGLPLPVPVTMRYPAHPATREDDYQELVIRELALDDWERVELGDEMDLLGPLATETLRRTGVLWPPNAYMLARLCQAAQGGTVLTGIDGDTLFSGSPWGRLPLIAARRARPGRRDLRTLGLLALPRQARFRLLRPRRDPDMPWLRPAGAAAVADAWARQEATEPAGWDAWIRWLEQSRYLAVLRRCYEALGNAWGANIVHPLFDSGFMAAVAAAGGRAGYADRREAVGRLFSDVLPRDIIDRRTKPHFSTVLWGERVEAFARTWSGRGLPEDLVDPERLRSEWLSGDPDLRSGLCLHAAWIAKEESSLQER